MENFKKVEVYAANKQEAIESAPYFIQGDATQAYKKWMETSVVTDANLKQFMVDQLKSKTKMAPGVGLIITIEKAEKDTRTRPYKVTDIKNEEGKRKTKKYHVLKDAETGNVLLKFDGTKAGAKQAAKELIKNGFHGKGYSEIEYHVEGKNAKEFEFEYAPSKNAHNGTYLMFGMAIENED